MSTYTLFDGPGVGRRLAHDPGDPLVTSHCPFCGSGQVVGRSDGTIGCDFCGQNYIVRVQPAFPGMPQMPGGPGAPSDVGPDGGLLDPGMVGPDGAPVDGGGPPPEDAGTEGGPEGLPDDGEEPPPPGDDGGDDATPSGPPPKKKSGKGDNKKESARFRGIEGQSLTEEQLIRHLAVRLSGAHPRVMAVLRAEGARRRVATQEAPYRVLSTGHQVSVGRLGQDWYGVIRHPQSSEVHYMHLGRGGDPHAEAERQLAMPLAKTFIHATSPQQAGAPGAPRTVRDPDWMRRPGPGTAPSEWRPAQASRGRRPFEALMRRHAEGPVSQDEWRDRFQAMHQRFDAAGMPGLPHHMTTELGHVMQVGLNRDTGHWHSRIYHYADNTGHAVVLHLGTDDEQVPARFADALRSRHVTSRLGEQYQRALTNMDEAGHMLSRRPRSRADQPPPHEFDFGG